MSNIVVVDYVQDAALLISRITASCPDLVLLDASIIEQEVMPILQQTKSLCPSIRYIGVAGNRELERAATAAGADAVLPRGFRTESLSGAIERLFPGPDIRKATPRP
jgi:DNA-binding NtrC family response regulator